MVDIEFSNAIIFLLQYLVTKLPTIPYFTKIKEFIVHFLLDVKFSLVLGLCGILRLCGTRWIMWICIGTFKIFIYCKALSQGLTYKLISCVGWRSANFSWILSIDQPVFVSPDLIHLNHLNIYLLSKYKFAICGNVWRQDVTWWAALVYVFKFCFKDFLIFST